jgi:apolipoprotein N-acyltransferase
MAPLLLAIRDAPTRRALSLGFVAGLVVHIAAQNWWFALLQRFAHFSLVPALGLSAVAIMWSAAKFATWAGLSRALVSRTRLPWVFAGPLTMGLIESLWPEFFVWHLGIALWRAWPLVQVAEVGGAASVSALLVLINTVVVELVVAIRNRTMPTRPLWIGGMLAGLIIAGGFVRAHQIDRWQARAPTLDVGILQPNFGSMTLEERSRDGRHLLAALRDGTRDLAKNGVDLIVWPETSWPYLWDRRRDREFPDGHAWSVRDRAPTPILMGALTHPFGSGELYNSAVLFRATGEIAGIYDRLTLVPFSEYVPFGDEYPKWKAAVQRQIPERPELTKGRSPVVLNDGPLRIGVLICAEDLDGRAARAATEKGANLLVSMANDGWFEGSAAVRQHMALAALRAVETRRHLVRVTTNGISGHVDALGRVRLEAPVMTLGHRERKPPTQLRATVALLDNPSLGASTIPYFPHACALTLLVLCPAGRKRMRQKNARKRRG